MLHRAIFNDISMLQKEMESLFPRLGLNFFPARIDNEPSGEVQPLINMYATETGYLLESALPGVAEESIDVSLTGNILTLSAEPAVDEPVDADRQWYRQERCVGKYLRRIELPDDIDSARVKAEYKQGLLRITLPKAEAALPKKINVQVDSIKK